MATVLRACPELSFVANEQGAFRSSENNFLTCKTTNTLGYALFTEVNTTQEATTTQEGAAFGSMFSAKNLTNARANKEHFTIEMASHHTDKLCWPILMLPEH
jgi:hypothetical protein